MHGEKGNYSDVINKKVKSLRFHLTELRRNGDDWMVGDCRVKSMIERREDDKVVGMGGYGV